MLTIVSIFHNRPDFISLQLESIRQNVIHDQINYIVANNARDNKMRREIKVVCKSLGVKCIPIKRNLLLELKIRLMYKERVFDKGNSYKNVNLACSYAFMYLWRTLLGKISGGTVCFMDSDMFFVGKFDPTEFFSSKISHGAIAFVPIIRNSKTVKYEIYHPWNGLFLANSSANKSLRSLEWHPGQISGMKLDVGGQGHYWLKNNSNSTNYIHLTSFSLYYLREIGGKVEGRVTVNGSFLCDFSLLSQDPLQIEFICAGPEAPYYPLDFSYLDKIFGEGDGIEFLQKGISRLLEVNKYFHGPEPKYFDLIGMFCGDEFNTMVFHYKSVSNYQEWSSVQYNSEKTQALREFLSSRTSF